MPAEVLIATIMRPEGESGLQTHIQQFVRYLCNERLSFALVTPFDVSKVIVYPTFAMRKLLGPLNGSLNVWWYTHWHSKFLQYALERHLSDAKPRIVYAHNPSSALAALRARVNSTQRVVMAVHFNISEAVEWADKGLIPRDGLMYRAVEAREVEALQRVDAIVYFSNFMHRTVQDRKLGIEGIPYKLIPNFIEDPGIEERVAEQLTSDLINVGTFEPRKNQAFILDVLAAARERGHFITATLVGDGPNRREIESKAQRLGLTDRVRFLGYIPHAAKQMRGHRAYIHAARIENFPLVLIEAMARGLPVFAPPVGGIPEAFQDGVEGRYLPLDNPAESAVRILEVLTNPSLVTAMGAASRARFLKCFDTKAVAPKLLSFLRGTVNRCSVQEI